MALAKHNIQKHLIPVSVFAVMFIFTVGTAYWFEQAQFENRRIEAEAQRQTAKSIVDDLIASVNHPQASLSANISANYAFSTENRSEQFSRFVNFKKLTDRYPSVILWAYAPVIPKDSLSLTLGLIEAEPGRGKLGYRAINVFPHQTKRSHFAPVVIAEPPSIRERKLGHNLLEDDARFEATERAIKTGMAQITKPVSLVLGVNGVILFQPVFKGDITPINLEQRRQNLAGFVVSAFSTVSLFNTVSDRFETLGVDVDIHDYGLIDAETRPVLSEETVLSASQPLSHNGKTVERRLLKPSIEDGIANYIDVEVAGRLWRVIIEHNKPVSLQDYFSHIILVFGTLFALFAAYFVYQQFNSANLLRHRVETRTQALEAARSELQRSRDLAVSRALTDPLTGLGNRRYLAKEYENAIDSGLNGDETFVVMLCDIDYFKAINDAKGHDFGDKILTDFAAKLTSTMDRSITLGDEFALFFKSTRRGCYAAKLATKLIKIINTVGVNNRYPTLSGSLGISVSHSTKRPLSELMKHADIALYEAKQNGRNGFVKFTKSLGQREVRKREVLDSVAFALEADEFVPAFQCLTSMETGEVKGFEVLARWQHKKRGLLTPAAFWEALCDDKIATDISIMIMGKALREAGELIAEGHDVGRLGINATEEMLKNRHFADQLLDLAKRHGLTAQNITIEVTERILLSHDTNEITQTLEYLSSKGVKIAFDDFGTGFASLTHLRTFPLDCVKIDRTFVFEIEKDRKSRAIVAAVSRMAHELGLTIVAEGIETEETAKIIKELECDEGQGFLYSKPTNIDGVRSLLAKEADIAA